MNPALREVLFALGTALGAGFSSAGRAAITSMVTTQRIAPMMSNPAWNQLTIGDIFSPSFRSAVIACFDNNQCSGAAVDYVAQIRANVLTPDPAGAPVFLVAGSYDQYIMPSEERCIVDRLQGAGVTTHVCLDAFANHYTVASNNVGYAIGWAQAILAGQPRPQCIYGAAASLGACTPSNATNLPPLTDAGARRLRRTRARCALRSDPPTRRRSSPP